MRRRPRTSRSAVAHRVRVDAARERRGRRRHRVLEVVRAAEPDLGRLHQRLAAPDQARRSCEAQLAARARRRTRPGAPVPESASRERRLGGVQHRDVVRRLVGEHAQLRREVVVEPIAWRSRWSSAKLRKTADLGRERGRCPRAGSSTPRRRPVASASSSPASALTGVPTLPATATGQPGGAVDRAEQLGRGRLAVRPGHRAELVRQQPPAELELADDVDAALARTRDHAARRAGTPGLLTSVRGRLDRGEKLRSIGIQVDFDARRAQAFPRSAAASGGVAGVAGDDPRPGSAARSASAAATPDRASPTTRYGPAGSGGRASAHAPMLCW